MDTSAKTVKDIVGSTGCAAYVGAGPIERVWKEKNDFWDKRGSIHVLLLLPSARCEQSGEEIRLAIVGWIQV